MRTLIVEDDYTSRLLLQEFLSQYGECEVAVNGREAVKAFRTALEESRKYDLMCMDILMPEMNGHQAAAMIRAIERVERILPKAHVKIFMTTALNNKDNVIRSAREACNAYLVKPIDTSVLLSNLKSFGLVPG